MLSKLYWKNTSLFYISHFKWILFLKVQTAYNGHNGTRQNTFVIKHVPYHVKISMRSHATGSCNQTQGETLFTEMYGGFRLSGT